ncbi:MAG: phosphomannomutase/phosphoglucomutase [Gammaproteobacteria bacterium]|nr:phosphomannomutase/phosphoglucomutase [Gammaproteobacteria bacterium]
MKGLMLLAMRIGDKPIALLSLIFIGLALFSGFSWQAQQLSGEQSEIKNQSQQQIARMVVETVTQHISALNSQMASLAQSPQLIAAMTDNDVTQIQAQQNALKFALPQAQTVCLFNADVDQPDDNACLPISFATLTSLRQAKQDGHADIAMISLTTDKAHALLAQRIVDSSGQVKGVLVVALKPDLISNLILKDYGLSGYVELQQKTKQAVVKLASQGDAGLKQNKPLFTQTIADTYWQVAYWSKVSESSTASWLVMVVVLVIVMFMLLLRELWQSLLIRADASSLRQAIKDLQSSKLKPKYHLAHSVFQDVIDEVQTVVHEMVTASTGKVVTQKKQPTSPLEIHAASVDAVVQKRQEIEIDPAIFKAYDIRGIVGTNINENIVKLLGQAIGSEAQNRSKKRLVVARDGRLSSESLSKALVEGLVSTGCEVVDIGQTATPLMYFACEKLGTQSGVMVTGSHNPSDYNGLKILLDGNNLAGDELKGLYQRIKQGNFVSGNGSKSMADVVDDYIKRIVGDVRLTRSIKVVIDAGNGVAGLIAPRLLQELGCDVIELNCEVDGTFPGHHPNPSQPENLQDLIKTVAQYDAELGIAFDGDGDRLGVVDASGNPVWPDRLMIMFAQDVLSRQPAATIIYDVKSSTSLADSIMRAGGEAVMSPSGHSIIKNKMREIDAQLAGEMSGHIFFKERWFGFDDGLYAAARLIELLASDPLERTPTEVFAAIPNRENTPEIVIEMAEGENHVFMEQLVSEAHFTGAQVTLIDGIRAEYSNGWGLVRASNTVPSISLRFEADTVENLHYIQQQFKQQMLQVKPTLTLNF